MKTKLPANPFCLAFGHNYFRTNNLAQDKPFIVCKSCNQQFKYNSIGEILELTG